LPQFGGVVPAGPPTASITTEGILDLVEMHMPNSESPTLNDLGTSLWATTTESGHKAIENLLAALATSQKGIRSVQVDLRMVTLPPEEAIAFVNAVGPAAEEAILKIAAMNDAAKTSIRCDNHSIATIASGLKRTYVVNATPVVGGDSPTSRSIGYRPETEEILLGLFGRIRPRLDDKGERARIELALQLTSGEQPEEIRAANYTDGGIIDRLELEISSLETTVAATENQWTLAGITALTNPGSPLTSGEALAHMVTLVRWKEVK
jgi:hypothetical protein